MPALIRTLRGHTPIVDEPAFLAETAALIGDVTVGAESSIWYGAVLRGDDNPITVGRRSNIQDGTIVHVSSTGQGTVIGDEVSIGHAAIIHACTLEDRSFVGMGATVMDGAVVESGAMVAAGALVAPGKIVRAGQVWMGNPGRHTRDLTEDEKKYLTYVATHYWELAQDYLGD
ncbi:gamma carbonic anhydrase family protein [Nisaea acidiphila]|uniref:gamma carbonic anhydrase family protein n=1 Tax=Nisaea acidiphila TaxID=1862145 RepID=UPI0027E2840B|nr:gamma carbonic anhydrase family protein [Nisaea acidiphila]